jgi:beta-glucosidase
MIKFIICVVVLVAAVFLVPFPKERREATPEFSVSDLTFPQGFFWGAATAAHQVEGNQDNNLTVWENANAERLAQEAEAKLKDIVPDWERIKPEATNPNNYISGAAVDHYNRYEEDLDLAKQIGLNSYRFSIEWSRIEPVKGQYDESALVHYSEVLAAMKERNMTPFVTLWHRSQPKWVTEQGDWVNRQTIEDYAGFVEFVASRLNTEVEYWMPFNEPAIHIVASYVEGNLPPEEHSLSKGNEAFKNMMEGHNRAYEIIHRVDSSAKVASTQALQYGEARPNTLANKALARLLNYQTNFRFLEGTKNANDFIAIQYYGPVAYSVSTSGVKIDRTPVSGDRTDFGWDIYPHSLYELLKEVHQRYNKPIIITENGIADGTDKLRERYVLDHLYWVKRAMDEGVPVQGYIYWTLMDNFEWDAGFWPKFGLIEIDRENNLARRIRDSVEAFSQVIRQVK